jgi:protein gp37
MFRESLNATRYTPQEPVRTKTVFNLPLKIKVPSKIFTSSLTDVFHEAIDPYRDAMWDIIRKCPQHRFLMLTKRIERVEKLLPQDWGNGYENVWLGTSVGHQDAVHRLETLQKIPAKIKFVSFEPLWSPIVCDLEGIDWIIIGGESGNENGVSKYRPCKFEWIQHLVEQGKDAGCAVFVKQLGTHIANQLREQGIPCDRHGGNWDYFPESLKIREFPK